MAKWAGKIGFGIQAETLIDGEPSGIWEETITEKSYKGDLIRSRRSVSDNNQVNDSMTIANQISFVADPYAKSNFNFMRYASFMGKNWKITSIEFESPRMTLTLGDLYNG